MIATIVDRRTDAIVNVLRKAVPRVLIASCCHGATGLSARRRLVRQVAITALTPAEPSHPPALPLPK